MGGGKRIFPDKNTPTDTTNRKIVLVRATIDGKATEERPVTVTFKAFDVDDPSGDSIIDTNGTSGNDNRPNGSPGTFTTSTDINQPGTSSTISAPVPVNSNQVSVYLTVTMQPGNNVVVAASSTDSLSGVTIDGTGLKDASGNTLPTTNINRTEMLTTWRKLHIEVDSMGNAQNNHVEGYFPSNRRVVAGYPVLQINVSPSLVPDSFENGRLVTDGRSYEISQNTANTITITNPTTFSITAFQTFTIYDDDDFDSDNGTTKQGDEGEDIPLLNQDFLKDNDIIPTDINTPDSNALATAYIRPTYDLSGGGDETTFFANILSESAQDIQDAFKFDNSNTEANTEFWTVYLLSGYQYTLAKDGDPITESTSGTRIAGISDTQNGQGSIIFFEAHSTHECYTTAIECSLAASKIHEIGHLLNANHNQGGVMDNLSVNFSATSINIIRSTLHP